MFKNETHNHPTEIEPFGGAATCLGGAIRDPLSGRSYVYQAMRVTGCGRPDAYRCLRDPAEHKLPQSQAVLTTAAARLFLLRQPDRPCYRRSYYEIYHPGYVAKRMEIGAVVGAAPAGERHPRGARVRATIDYPARRHAPAATAAAVQPAPPRQHTAESSLTTCGAEVQKGNPPEERKIQRLFRDEQGHPH